MKIIAPVAIKMVDGTVIFAEIMDNKESNILFMVNPIEIYDSNGQITSCHYMPYSDVTMFPVPSHKIMSVAPLDEFFTRFYGSALLKFEEEKMNRLEILKGDLRYQTRTLDTPISEKSKELEFKYGFLHKDGQNRTLH